MRYLEPGGQLSIILYACVTKKTRNTGSSVFWDRRGISDIVFRVSKTVLFQESCQILGQIFAQILFQGSTFERKAR